MTYFVPFTGTPLAKAALRRATELAGYSDADVLAFTVIPRGNVEWAREHGLLGDGEAYDANAVVATARQRVSALAPDAEFDHAFVGQREVSGRIASAIRKRAHEADAEVVFLGSENAGHVATSIAEVGPNVAADDSYDVYIARHPDGS